MKPITYCRCTPLADTLCCAPVRLRDYSLQSLYVGPTGAFAVASNTGEAGSDFVYRQLCEFLGTSRIGLYVSESNQLLSLSGETVLALSEAELQEVIFSHTQNDQSLLWSPDMLGKLSEKIRCEDARNRGIYCDENGKLFIARNGNFRPMSNKDPDRILRLTLFGGILGIHRFALGQWVTALFYLLTGGLMGLGWLMDLLQLHLGVLKDKQKCYLAKPEPVPLSRYLVGIAINTAIFCSYSLIARLITGSATDFFA